MKKGLKNYCEELKTLSEGKKPVSDRELQYHAIKIKNYQHMGPIKFPVAK